METKLNNFSEEELNIVPFPEEIFPKEIRDIVDDYAKALNISKDYAYGVILFAFSAAIGTGYILRVKKGWEEMGNLFISLVGKPGINKSSPISIFTKVLEAIDTMLNEDYQAKMKEFRERKASKDDTIHLEEPIRRQIVIKDTTQEALLQALYHNPNGLAGIYDELGSFLKSFNKYRPGGGGDEELMLSIFSGKSIYINRKNVEPVLIPNPFFNLIGSIQPQVLINLMGNNRVDNGLTHRFLFIYPPEIKREDLSDEDVSSESEELYDLLIKSIIKPKEILLGNHQTRKIGLSKGAMEVYKGFRRRINGIMNNEKSEAICGIYAKLDTYFFRLSLVIHIIRVTCMENECLNLLEVSSCSASRAEKLIDYFEYMALRVFKLLDKHRDPLASYPLDHKKIYYRLPARFTTAEGLAVSLLMISRRTFFNMLNDEYLFVKIKHGVYEKVW
ncbi:Protein of unknown function [Arachidicoccus rhizosphaerae]|uniref:DUF3987 domain-containing protein n=1 Tax=Arachidicoccus rhizosphaerae TaxID=551991 RepID=A0A1H4B0M9_9BACT|nr:DUF3987 domain-containing protein [Arachidicoccus rhizosphaerae]SEA41442.1 Protein of unknown function [Arachidicoccus rhizosphaerae]